MDNKNNYKKYLGYSSIVVIVYAVFTALIMAYEAFVLKFGDRLDFYVNRSLTIPIETFANLWIYLASIYIGVDRTVFCFKTTQLKYGECDVGNPSRIRDIIFISCLLMLESIVLSTLTDFDYSLKEFITAFGVSCVLYVAGQKAIKAGTFKDGKFEFQKVEIQGEKKEEVPPEGK